MSKMQKMIVFVCTLVLLVSVFLVKQGVYANNDEQAPYYTIVLEDGRVEHIPFSNHLPAQQISIISDDMDDSVELLNSIQYGVARILGYTTYKEYDGTNSKLPRSGYVHGTSANDAAFICVLDDKTVRVKQAGIYIDIPVENVTVSEYNKDSQVSYYMSKNNMLYHYYYHGEYSMQSALASTCVGYTPEYLKENTKYYSYDGHYFYTNYKTMINDYKTGVNYNKNAVNKTSPYYNYYQYLSFRTPSKFNETQYNTYIDKGINKTNKTSVFNNMGTVILNNEKTYSINSSLLLGVAINESAWGTSYFATSRYNLFGIKATDANPNNALSFKDINECIQYFSSRMLSDGYLDGRDYRYRGAHLGDKQSGVNVYYASDPYWGEKAASYSYYLNMDNNHCDYKQYDIVISQNGNVIFYKDKNLVKGIYSSGASVNNNINYFVYNIPFTVIDKETHGYKIYSDTVLNDERTKINGDSLTQYDISRDYVYVDKNEVKLIYEKDKEPVYIKGDVNGDGKVTSLDFILIKNHIMNTKVLKDDQLFRADVNQDDKVTSLDFILIKNHIMGIKKLY